MLKNSSLEMGSKNNKNITIKYECKSRGRNDNGDFKTPGHKRSTRARQNVVNTNTQEDVMSF